MRRIKVAAISVANYIGEFEKSLSKLEEWASKAKEENVELILFPELNLSGYIPAEISHDLAEPINGPTTEKVVKIAQKLSMTIGFGLIEKNINKTHCTHVLVNKDGIIGKQSKIHVPYHEAPYWSSGKSINVFDIGGAKVGISICRDSFFPEYQRTLYFKGAEIVLMPFSYYNVPRSQFLNGTQHGRSIQVNSWNNGVFSVFCNNAEDRPANRWETNGKKFPGWAGIIDPWGRTISYNNSDGNNECMVISDLDPSILEDRRKHPNFLAEELRTDLYKFEH